jgi:putative two-component system response regulator
MPDAILLKKGALNAEEILIDGRIVALADVFDALTCERPHTAAWAVQTTLDLLRRESGSHFAPELVDLFMAHLPEILEIQQRWREAG